MSGKMCVLSGGGPKGAFQVGALKYLREKKGYAFSMYSGVSIGALNAVFEAAGKHRRLEELWETVSPGAVYGRTRSHTINAGMRILSKKASLYELDAIREIVAEIDPKKLKAEVLVSAVSLISGEAVTFRSGDPEFKEALVASAAVPMMFSPVHVSPQHLSMVDGAVRSMIPVGSVLPYEPEEIVIISCNSCTALRVDKAPTTLLGIFQRSLEIMMYEIFQNDVNAVLRNNSLVMQAAANGFTLTNRSGKPLRYYPVTLIEPDERLGKTTDFTKSMAKRCFAAGYEKAKKVVP